MKLIELELDWQTTLSPEYDTLGAQWGQRFIIQNKVYANTEAVISPLTRCLLPEDPERFG